MFSYRILKKLTFNHISILKKYDFKNHNRFKNADKYIADHNFDKIKNYNDFCTKPKQVKNVQLTLTQEQQQYIHSTYLYQRQAIAWTKKLGLQPYRPDDQQIAYPIENKTLLSFAKQSLKERKPHQLLFLYGITSIIIHTVLYFTFWYGVQADQYVANLTLNPQFLETYSLQHCQPYIKEYKRKMGVQLQQILEINEKLKMY